MKTEEIMSYIEKSIEVGFYYGKAECSTLGANRQNSLPCAIILNTD